MSNTELQNSMLLHEEKQGHIYKEDPYVTYHTTGRVNYHFMNLEVQFLEPLYVISKPNPFFVMYFNTIKAFNPTLFETKKPNIIVDITEVLDKGLDVIFSIVPTGYVEKQENSLPCAISLNYPLFNILIEFLEDSALLKLGEREKDRTVIKIRPSIEYYAKQKVSKNEAFLDYEHLLYKTEDAIIKAPNGEGAIEVVFPVEMRRAPWICIRFNDIDLEIAPQSVKRCNRDIERARVQFKVRNKKTKQIIKDHVALGIKEIILDAEIYDDESIPPEGFI